MTEPVQLLDHYIRANFHTGYCDGLHLFTVIIVATRVLNKTFQYMSVQVRKCMISLVIEDICTKNLHLFVLLHKTKMYIINNSI